MASSTKTCSLLTEFLSTMNHDASNGTKGRKMMMQKLRGYLWWKSQLLAKKQEGKMYFAMPDTSRRPGDGLYGQNEDTSEGNITRRLRGVRVVVGYGEDLPRPRHRALEKPRLPRPIWGGWDWSKG